MPETATECTQKDIPSVKRKRRRLSRKERSKNKEDADNLRKSNRLQGRSPSCEQS